MKTKILISCMLSFFLFISELSAQDEKITPIKNIKTENLETISITYPASSIIYIQNADEGKKWCTVLFSDDRLIDEWFAIDKITAEDIEGNIYQPVGMKFGDNYILSTEMFFQKGARIVFSLAKNISLIYLNLPKIGKVSIPEIIIETNK